MRIKYFIISFVSCFFLQANAQTTNNTIVNDNSVWNILSIQVEDETGVVNIPRHTTKIYFNGDYILNSKTYKKVFHCFDDELCENPIFYGLIQEENKKTYFVFPNEMEEYLLYDFSVEVGDIIKFNIPGIPIDVEEEFRTFYLQVHSIDFVDVNGVFKKKIELTYPNSESIVDVWVENLGSLYDFYTVNFQVGYAKVLSCYFQGKELIYKNPEFPNCYYATGISRIEQHNNIRYWIFFGVLNLEFDSPVTGTMSIFNLAGQSLYSNKLLHQSHASVKIASFDSGIYLLHIKEDNGRAKTLKINHIKTF